MMPRTPRTDETEARAWTPNARAFGLFVAVVLILLSLPTLDDPLPIRVGRGLVWLAQAAGIEIGPIGW